MSDEVKLTADMGRGARAEALLRDELLQEAFTTIDDNVVALWREAQTPEAREQQWRVLHALRLVKRYLESVVKDGRLAQAELDALAKLPNQYTGL